MYQIVQGGVKNLESKAFIPEGSRKYADYQTWLDEGNTPDPEPIEQLRARLKDAVATEGHNRVDNVGPIDARQQRRYLMKAIKLVRKQAKGTLNQEEAVELDQLEAIGDTVEGLEITIESAQAGIDLMEREALEAYDPVSDPEWSV